MPMGHISSLASPFPILFLPSPCLFCNYLLCFLFPVPFHPFSHLPLPTNNPPCYLHFCDSVPVLVVCLVFVFLGSVVDNCEFVVILLFIVFDLLFLRWVPLTFHIIRAWWWWTLTWPCLGITYQLKATPFAVLWHYMWARGQRGKNATCYLARLSPHFPSLPSWNPGLHSLSSSQLFLQAYLHSNVGNYSCQLQPHPPQSTWSSLPHLPTSACLSLPLQPSGRMFLL